MPADRDLSSSAVRKLVVLLYLAAGLACVPLSFVQPPTLPGIGPVSDVPSSRENIGRALRDEMELARAPRFSPPGHFYAGTIHVSLSSVLPEAGIYYTLDGSQPAENGMPYTRPLVLEPGEDAGCVVVKAVAVSNGQAGPAVTH
ncbi:MAG: chitobiase/beta-hexosaminidase C-terminal domain-containing protein, partial [Desulfovibrio sp.]|nr:chitobiase/beta-hexosaminidase C-terminal domain-containing protein [Desulfovibrio sp.]